MPNTNPVVADGSGRFPAIYIPNGEFMSIRLRDSVVNGGGVIVATQDDVPGVAILAVTATNVIAALAANTGPVVINGTVMSGTSFAAFADNFSLNAAGSIDTTDGSFNAGLVTATEITVNGDDVTIAGGTLKVTVGDIEIGGGILIQGEIPAVGAGEIGLGASSANGLVQQGNGTINDYLFSNGTDDLFRVDATTGVFHALGGELKIARPFGNENVIIGNTESSSISWAQFGGGAQFMSFGFRRGSSEMEWTDAAELLGTIRMSLSTGGALATSTGALGMLSERRFKENIVPATSQLTDIKILGGLMKNFNMIGDKPKILGWIVDEIETEFPGLIYTSGDKKGVILGAVPLKAVKALAETIEMVDAQAVVIADLTARIEVLEGA